MTQLIKHDIAALLIGGLPNMRDASGVCVKPVLGARLPVTVG